MSQSENKQTSDTRSTGSRRSGSRSESQRSSGRASYGGSISDIETDDYRKLSKKLTKDKAKLKDKLRHLLDDIDKKTDEHRKEMEYFQDQINDLAEERDKSNEALEEMRSAMIDEKEKIRQNFDQKLTKHKETLEKRYGAKDSQVVKRLENTIVTLQERLTQQIEEREHVKETAESYYSQKEEKLRQNVAELEEQLRKTKEIYAKDRLELQKVAKTFNDEKEFMIARMKKEKEDEITVILADKNASNVALQNLKEQMEKRAKVADSQRDDQIAKMKHEVADIKRDYEMKFLEANNNFKNSITEIKQQYEGKLYSQEQLNKTSMELLVKENEKVLYNITGESSRKIDQVINDTRIHIEEQKNTIVKLQKNLEDTIAEADKKQESIIRESQLRYEAKDKELREISLRYEKINGELSDTNAELKEQLVQVKDTMKKIQDSSFNVGGQMISTLNKQKEHLDKEIATRDATIERLDRQLKKIAEETIDRLNTAERKCKNLGDELKEISEKYIATKAVLDKKEKDFLIQKDENSRVKESNDLYIEKIKKSQFEKELLETKVKTFEEMGRTKELAIEAERKKASQLYLLSQTLHTQLKEQELELDKKDKTLRFVQTELETVTRNLNITTAESNRVKNQMTDEFKKIANNLQSEKDRQVEELRKANLQLEKSIETNNYNNELSKAQFVEGLKKESDRVINELNTQIKELKKANIQLEGLSKSQVIAKDREVELLKAQLAEGLRREISKLTIEKDRQIEELKKRNNTMEQTIHIQTMDKSKNLDSLREEYKREMEKKISERDKNVMEKDKQVEELRKKISQMDQVFRMQQLAVQNASIQDKKDKEELIQLRAQATRQDDQLLKIEKMSAMLQESRNHFQEVINKMKVEQKTEMDKMIEKLKEMTIKANAASQLADQTKATYASYLEANSKKAGPDAQLKVTEIEKERDSLLAQLASADKKIMQLQSDISNSTATIRIKSQLLAERETSIRKDEEALRNAPPRLLDPSIKKSRDEALSALRQSRLELGRIKEEIVQTTQKLQIAEGTVKELQNEKVLIMNSQNEIKEAFVNNLNQQNQKHDAELSQKNARIKELETMLMDKIKG